MKREQKNVRPIFLDEKLYAETLEYVKKCRLKFNNWISSAKQREMLNELHTKLANLAGYATMQNAHYETSDIYKLNRIEDIVSNFSKTFLFNSNALISPDTLILNCTPSQMVSFKNGNINEIVLSEADYINKSISCAYNFNFKHYNLLNAYNHSKTNIVFIIDGCYENPNPYKIPADKVKGIINFNGKGELYQNPAYIKSISDNNGKIQTDFKEIHDEDVLEFAVPAGYKFIETEITDLPDESVDVVADIFKVTGNYLNGLKAQNRLNKPNNESFIDNLVEIADYVDLTVKVLEDNERKINRGLARRLSEDVNPSNSGK